MPPKKEPKEKPIDLARGFAELEEIATWFESDQPDIDAGLEKFERAMIIADALKTKLTAAENTVKEIKKRFSGEE